MRHSEYCPPGLRQTWAMPELSSPWKRETGRPRASILARRFPAVLIAIVISLSAGNAPIAVRAAANIESARVKEIAAMLPARPIGLGRPITDRVAWEKLARSPGFASVMADAVKLAQKPSAPLPDDLFLDYSRTGNRDRCQHVMAERQNRLTTFTVAECLENQGRFVGPLAETISAICAERTWVYPAHDGKLNNFYGRTVEMDLRATAIARELATADFLPGDKLPSETRRLIRENVQRRVLQPYRDMVEGRRDEIYWLRATHNWNAVCLAGTTGAALALVESPEERAWFVAAAEHYIRNFLKGFTPDGYCSEGLGYWNYGFGHFVMLGEAVRQATGNKIDLLADPAALQPARFGSRDEILNGIYPSIADSHPGGRPDPQLAGYIAERLGLPMSGSRDEIFVRSSGSLAATAMYAFLTEPLPIAQRVSAASESPLRTWFKDGGVLICRPAPAASIPFAAALKGGHNAEHHNHNDVGSFSVVMGKTMIVCDPGAEVYTARTFSSKRYVSKVLNSFGHAVPVIAGQLQRTGSDARAVVLRSDFRDEEDVLALDIRSAYAVPELKRLERTFVFHRADAASLTVRDEVAFNEPKAFETVLITWGDWKKVSDHELLLSDGADAVRVKIDAGGRPFKVSAETLNEDVRTPRKPVRLGIALDSPVKEAAVILTITPDRTAQNKR
jgi:hypothetical protein